MKMRIWGSRGSLSASSNTIELKEKIFAAVKGAKGREFKDDREVRAYVDDLPFPMAGYYGSNTSCVEITGGNEYVVCDAGTGIADLSRNLSRQDGLRGKPRIFNIFLSHLHWDHIQGFPYFMPCYRKGDTIIVRGGHKAMRRAFEYQKKFSNISIPEKATIEFHMIRPGEWYDIAGFRVLPFKQNHPGSSFGYRFERDGKSIVYSTDCEHFAESGAPDYPFLDFFRNAGLLVMDAQYTLESAFTVKENWGHSNNVIAVELAALSHVKHLCLFHNEPTVDDGDLQSFLEATRRYLDLFDEANPLKISLAYDGLEIEV